MEKKSGKNYRAGKHELRKAALGLVEELAERKTMRVVRRLVSEQKQAKEKHLRMVQYY